MSSRMPLAARSLVTVALLGVVAFGATACSSSSSKDAAGNGAGGSTAQTTATTVKSVPASSKGPNPCELITAAQAQQILGKPATAQGPKSEFRGTDCHWSASGGGSVLVQVYQGKEFYDPSLQGNKPQKLAGVGDDAFVDDFGTTRTTVGFIKGDTVVFINGVDIASSATLVSVAKGVAANV
jgi:hypothetical protein